MCYYNPFFIKCCLILQFPFQQKIAQEILTALKEDPNAWTRVDAILEFSKNQQTKYYGLQILENVIKTRWKILPRNQCEGILYLIFFDEQHFVLIGPILLI